jgi:hypothetical protein
VYSLEPLDTQQTAQHLLGDLQHSLSTLRRDTHKSQ